MAEKTEKAWCHFDTLIHVLMREDVLPFEDHKQPDKLVWTAIPIAVYLDVEEAKSEADKCCQAESESDGELPCRFCVYTFCVGYVEEQRLVYATSMKPQLQT